MVTLVQNQTRAQAENVPCEILFDLYPGPTGTVRLGRLLAGKDAGRLVLLRPVNADAARRTRALVDRVRNISHPKLLKVMDSFAIDGQDYIASEYVAGAPLQEFCRALDFQTAKELAVLVHVLCDALSAAHSGRRLLDGLYGYHVERALFEDAIWIAEFGDAFVMELGIFEAIVSGRVTGSGVRGAGYVPDHAGPQSADVHATGTLLFEVLSRRSRVDGALFGLPTQTNKALANVVTLALSSHDENGFPSPAALVEALRQLPPGLSASSADVSALLELAFGTRLDEQREKLRSFERTSAVQSDDERTEFHRASGLDEAPDSETLRPGAPASGVSDALHRLPPRPLPPPRLPPPRVPSGAPLRVPPLPSAGPTFEPDEAITDVYLGGESQPSSGFRSAEPGSVTQVEPERVHHVRSKPAPAFRDEPLACEPTAVSGGPSQVLTSAQPARRSPWFALVLLVVLVVLSAAITWGVVRFGQSGLPGLGL